MTPATARVPDVRAVRQVPITRPWMDEREADAARRPILAGWTTQGPEVLSFEKELAAAVGATHACAVSSCTTALHLALLVAGVRPGDEVVTVSHSFIATANAVRYCGAIPVLIDVDPATYDMDPALVQLAISERTRAILCVHQLGMPCDLARLVDIARRNSLPHIEDAACAAGSVVLFGGRWERIGKPHGDVACFSFHPRKVISTGDGGMITTSHADWDARFRLLRQHGMSVPDTVRHGARVVILESYPVLGWNYRLTDVQAAVGREQLRRLPEIVERRRRLAARYREILAGIPGLGLPEEPPWARTNWQSFCVRLPDACDQRRVMQHLLDRGVASRRGVMCAHREPAYARGAEPWSCGSGPGACACPGGRCTRLRESERAQDRTILLPLFPQMSDEDQDHVASALAAAVRAEGGHA